MNIIEEALRLASAVARYCRKAKRLFYEVMLFDRMCVKCNGSLKMISESRCQCDSCGVILDPTVAFQRCPECGGEPELGVRRYRCSQCGSDISSRFVFDGLVFDAEYFRKKMAESRRRKQERRERFKLEVSENRSPALETTAIEFGAVPGLMEALNALISGEGTISVTVQKGFDLNRYQTHIQAHLGDFEICFEDIPPLEEDPRKDRIWRFIALIFMDHAGLLEIGQEGLDILVNQVEVDRKRCGIPG